MKERVRRARTCDFFCLATKSVAATDALFSFYLEHSSLGALDRGRRRGETERRSSSSSGWRTTCARAFCPNVDNEGGGGAVWTGGGRGAAIWPLSSLGFPPPPPPQSTNNAATVEDVRESLWRYGPLTKTIAEPRNISYCQGRSQRQIPVRKM